jgi:hypothetical protein
MSGGLNTSVRCVRTIRAEKTSERSGPFFNRTITSRDATASPGGLLGLSIRRDRRLRRRSDLRQIAAAGNDMCAARLKAVRGDFEDSGCQEKAVVKKK